MEWAIERYGAFVQPAGDAMGNLAEALAEAMPRPPRRLSRFAQLTLIGAQRCMACHGPELAATTPLYNASIYGPLASTVSLMHEMLLQGHPLKPVPFINLSGNAGSFHVAAGIGLRGRNITVARQHGPMGAALELAAIDSAERIVLGSTVECVWPLADHRERCDLPPDTPLFESSYWFVLRAGTAIAGDLGQLRYARCAADQLQPGWIDAADWHCIDPQLPEPQAQALAAERRTERQLDLPETGAGNLNAVWHAVAHHLDTGRAGTRLRAVARDQTDALQCLEVETPGG